MDFVLNSSLLGGYGGVVNKHPSFEQAKECWDLVINDLSCEFTSLGYVIAFMPCHAILIRNICRACQTISIHATYIMGYWERIHGSFSVRVGRTRNGGRNEMGELETSV